MKLEQGGEQSMFPMANNSETHFFLHGRTIKSADVMRGQVNEG